MFCLRLDCIKKKFVVVAWWHSERGGFVVLMDDLIHSWSLGLKGGKHEVRSAEEQRERLDLYLVFPYKLEY